MDITVVVITTDRLEQGRVEVLNDYTYRSGQAIVGGLIVGTELPSVNATLWSNEEAQLLQMPFNRNATAYLWSTQPEHVGITMLGGQCYITGAMGADGYLQSVPDEVIGHFIL